MTDYVRVLSYIYLYEDDRKVGNVGFVKMDGRDGIVKILVNIRLPFKNDLRKLQLVVYNEDDGEIIQAQVGEMRLVNGAGEFRGTLRSELVVNSLGMNIHSTDEGELLQFATYFKDTDINILKIKEKDTTEIEAEEPIYNIDFQAESIEAANIDCEESEGWEKMCRQYCKCRMLGDEYQCIRIAGKDILLIKCIADNSYYVGIPGCYHKNEKNAAEIFGFSKFLFSKNKRKDSANCGYWIAKIDIS